ncbi:MAG: class I SAM-dependent methyltransferase [Pararhodobacter sp.]
MQFKDVPGWFAPIDQAAFAWILQFQNRTESPGDLLEMGTFKGRSAIVMGRHRREGERFTVCDLFDDITTSQAAHATEQRFFRAQSLTQAEFERNYLAFHAELPAIVRAPTSTITAHVAPASCRFVHIDASHVYENVREDTHAARRLLRENGVVAFDDFRKPQTLGTAAAVWEAILNEGLRPIANTDFKLYATWGDPLPLQAEIARRAAQEKWCRTAPPVMIRDMPMIHLFRNP